MIMLNVEVVGCCVWGYVELLKNVDVYTVCVIMALITIQLKNMNDC